MIPFIWYQECSNDIKRRKSDDYQEQEAEGCGRLFNGYDVSIDKINVVKLYNTEFHYLTVPWKMLNI